VSAITIVSTAPTKVDDVIPAASPVFAKVAVEVTSSPFGFKRVHVTTAVTAVAESPVVMMFKSETITVPVAVGAVLDEAGTEFVFEAPIVRIAALDGTTESIPKPNVATATSAMRLKVVFVDIFFLSFSREQEFPALGFG